MLAVDLFVTAAGFQGSGILDGLKRFVLHREFKMEAAIPTDAEGRPIPIEGVNVRTFPEVAVESDPYPVRVMPQPRTAEITYT